MIIWPNLAKHVCTISWNNPVPFPRSVLTLAIHQIDVSQQWWKFSLGQISSSTYIFYVFTPWLCAVWAYLNHFVNHRLGLQKIPEVKYLKSCKIQPQTFQPSTEDNLGMRVAQNALTLWTLALSKQIFKQLRLTGRSCRKMKCIPFHTYIILPAFHWFTQLLLR